MRISFSRIAVTKPPDGWFHGITQALYELYRQALVEFGATVLDVPMDAFLPPDVVRISGLLKELRAFRPELAMGLSHGAHALICRMPAERDGWRRNFFTEILDVPTLCLWDHAPLEFADQLLPRHPSPGAREHLRRVLTHPRLIHWSRDSGQIRIMRELGFLLPDRIIHEATPSLPGFAVQDGCATDAGVGFIGHVYQSPVALPNTIAEWLDASPTSFTTTSLWDVLTRKVASFDESGFWRFAHHLIAHEGQTAARLKMLGAAGVPVTCYGDLKTDVAGVPKNLLAAPGEIPFGPPLARVLGRHAITIDVLNPGFVDGYSHKPVLGFASGGFVLVNRKADFVSAFGEAGEAVSYGGAEELRAKVDHFVSHAGERQEAGDAIRERIRERFQLKQVVQRVLEAAWERAEPSQNVPQAGPAGKVTPVRDLISHLRKKPEWDSKLESFAEGILLSTSAEAWAWAAEIVVPDTRKMKEPHLRIELQVQEGKLGIGRIDDRGQSDAELLLSAGTEPLTIAIELAKEKSQTVILRTTVQGGMRVLILGIHSCHRAA